MRTLLQLITQYDEDQQETIRELLAENAKLKKEHSKFVNQAFDNAIAADNQKLKDIMAGVYDNIGPTDTREKLLNRLINVFVDFEKNNPSCKIHLPEIEFQFRQDYGNVSFHWDGKEFIQK